MTFILFPVLRLSQTTSSCVHQGGRHVPAQRWAAKCGCTCLTIRPQTTASGRVWLSATSMPAMALSCLSSLTRPQWPTSPWCRQRSCCPIGCCATGVPSPTLVTPPRGSSRRPSAASSVCLFGHATLTPAAGWSWTWPCVHMHKWEPGTIYVTSGTNWVFTSEETGWAGRGWAAFQSSNMLHKSSHTILQCEVAVFTMEYNYSLSINELLGNTTW